MSAESYEPEREALRLLIRERADPDTLEELLRLYREGWRDLSLRLVPPLTARLLRQMKPLSSADLAEKWMLLIVLSHCVEGVAAGRGRTQIEPEDVATLRESLCADYPRCATTRVQMTGEALELLARGLAPASDEGSSEEGGLI